MDAAAICIQNVYLVLNLFITFIFLLILLKMNTVLLIPKKSSIAQLFCVLLFNFFLD